MNFAHCRTGYYCNGGEDAVSGACSAGYVCPLGSSSTTDTACPAGRYSSETDLYSIDQCDVCYQSHSRARRIRRFAGVSGWLLLHASVHFGDNVSSRALLAEQRHGVRGSNYLLVASIGLHGLGIGVRRLLRWLLVRVSRVRLRDSRDRSCDEGATEPTECGVGYYSSSSASSCLSCPAGYYCGSNTTTLTNMLSNGGSWANADDPAGRCFNGTWCPSGMTRAPTLATEACPAGNYCPIATANPVPCAAGKYNPFDGADGEEDCSRTLRGYYTIAGASTPTGLCEPGYYCPEGSTGPREVPCPVSTYNPYYGRWSDDDCSLCVSGGYCEEGSAFPSVCPRGYFCIAGVSSFSPCPDGTFGNASGLRREEDCSSCSPGYFCDGTGLPRPRGLCDPGYYCIEGSNTSSPNGPNSPIVSAYVPASTRIAHVIALTQVRRRHLPNWRLLPRRQQLSDGVPGWNLWQSVWDD